MDNLKAGDICLVIDASPEHRHIIGCTVILTKADNMATWNKDFNPYWNGPGIGVIWASHKVLRKIDPPDFVPATHREVERRECDPKQTAPVGA